MSAPRGGQQGHGVAATLAVVCGVALVACAASAPTPRTGFAAVTGTLELVPREGVPSHHASGAYGDRRLRDVTWFDYSKPDSAVVYLDLGTRPGGHVALAVETTRTGVRLAPRFAAVGAGGVIEVANRSERVAMLSIPGLDRVERIEPGHEVTLDVERAGPLELFLLGAEEPSVVWAAPGPWTRPAADGRYVLTDLHPGPATLHAWHPRLPGTAVPVELRADEVAQRDLQLGVGRSDSHDAH
jgi:hypothetical protein